jgi:hypothetical protein
MSSPTAALRSVVRDWMSRQGPDYRQPIPSKLVSAVITNTVVKIVHQSLADHRQAVSATMNLTVYLTLHWKGVPGK